MMYMRKVGLFAALMKLGWLTLFGQASAADWAGHVAIYYDTVLPNLQRVVN